MKLLAIDSSAKVAAAAICTEDKILAETMLDSGLTHSQTLMPVVYSLLENAGFSFEEIDAFAVSVGPGSFTGLRIGMAAVKGMAYALQKPCYPVSTLEALAYNLIGIDGIVCAAMDARRSQVYNALFRISGETVTRLCEDRAISVSALLEEVSAYSEPVRLCGDGAMLCARQAAGEISTLRLSPPALRYQRASGVAAAAFHLGHSVCAKDLLPQYLRLPQAERERLERTKKLAPEQS